ncbi:MAG TPA: ABC transporter ATP-binding protein/permease [Candidatus Blautia faecavium]|uniref:ABC transporter ATP-binding protein/permease n=1 Tax=Candidatus Blautia faecavium TaxID=2838487 RepID=A0A9D2LSK9_9FIRM|nr:ABC transporter ATP-binding protein/permease [Candidatus Blautia faecavium]
MLRLMKYLKKSAGYIVLIVALLFLQAYCDLSLPDYTSKIVNVGIQQQGIEDGVPEKMRAATMESLSAFTDEEGREKIADSYTQEEELYVLKDDITKEDREELNDVICQAIMLLSQHASQTGQGMEGGAQLSSQLSQMPDSMVEQAAAAFVRAEYEAIGEDVDRIQMHYILESGLEMLLMALLIMAASISVTFLSSRVAAALGHDLRNGVYRKVMGFSSSEYHKFSTASLITRSTNDVQQVQLTMAMMFRIVLYAPILGIGGVIRVLQTDSSMTWILGLGVALILAVILMLFLIAMPKFTKLQTLIDRLNLVTREILTGIPVIRAFSREKHEEERFEAANRNLTRTNLFVNRCMTFMMPVMMLIMNGISVLIIYNGAYAVDDGSMQVGNVMAFIQYAMQIIMSFLMITAMSIMLPRANVAAGRIVEVLNTKETIRDPENPVSPEAGTEGTVEFDHVSFAYPEADENVLTDITFKASKGQQVAIIGSTGSGKSTLINLIPRFYDVTEGSVRVDGVDVRDMSQKELRDKLGYVPQKGVLFSGTIDSNIRYGKADLTREEVERAAKIAQADDFIMEKNHTYDSPVAQGGTNVSGGQKQRLSIARAIAKNPEILIFDDSFSALDFKTDSALRKAIKDNTKDITTIIVAQRISTIMKADRIIVLDDGKMAGIGTHKELMKNCEVYRQIAMSQLSEEELANE